MYKAVRIRGCRTGYKIVGTFRKVYLCVILRAYSYIVKGDGNDSSIRQTGTKHRKINGVVLEYAKEVQI